MELSDLLFFDVRLHNFENWDGNPATLTNEQKDEVLKNYNNELNNKFVFGPVEFATNLSYRDVEFGHDTHTMVTAVPKALNIVTYGRNINTEFRNGGDPLVSPRLDLASTTVYSYSSLTEWLPKRGFEILWSKEDSGIGMFLIKKR